jgi:hypothetical protein
MAEETAAVWPPARMRSHLREVAMKVKELEDIAWRLIAEAKAEGNPNRRHRLMQEAFELVRCASALREMDAETDANVAPHAMVGRVCQKPLGKV